MAEAEFESDKTKEVEEGPEKKPKGREAIWDSDFRDARVLLEKTYKEALENGKAGKLENKKDNITEEMVEAALRHTERVRDFAVMIGEGEKENLAIKKRDEKQFQQKQFVRQLELAALLHDISKLNPQRTGGLDILGHHETGAQKALDILREKFGIEGKIAEKISNAIKTHSHVPHIIEQEPNPPVPEPITLFELALRDADVLDQMDVNKLKEFVQIGEKMKYYEKDPDALSKSVAGFFEKARKAKDLMATETAKKIANTMESRLKKLIDFLGGEKIKTIEDFDNAFERFRHAEDENSR